MGLLTGHQLANDDHAGGHNRQLNILSSNSISLADKSLMPLKGVVGYEFLVKPFIVEFDYVRYALRRRLFLCNFLQRYVGHLRILYYVFLVIRRL